MKLRKLKSIIDKCVINAGDLDPEVEIWVGGEMSYINSIGQFGMIPDVSIVIGDDEDED